MAVAARAGERPLLDDGAVVAGRYRVVRFIDAGGMGEVYEAEDAVAGERVALKMVRLDAAEEGAAAERLRRELQLARRVTHPHVCRIFDLGWHRPEGVARELPFLTMELCAGETLASRMRRCGRMTLDEARPIVEQLCAALDAAHAAGVVHRDFKSGNVLLVGDRAVVTDFGLARASDGSSATLTRTGDFVGTPAFMAPEQVEGGVAVGPAADVYALGVVMYQLATGSLPWSGERSLQVAVARLHAPPPPPRRLVPDLDRGWERAIVRCLARHPEDRFARAGDVVKALAGLPVAPPRRARRRRRAWVAAAVVASLAVAAGADVAWRRAHAPALAVAAGAHRSVVVLDFRNLSGRPADAWLATAIGEMLRTELGAGGALRVVPGARVARLRADLALDDGNPSREALANVAAVVADAWVVHGSFVVLGDRVRVDARIDDAASGLPIVSDSESGPVDGVDALVERLATRMRAPAGVRAATSDEQRAARAALPSVAAAARPYAEGLAHLRRDEYAAARERLAEAVAADPAWALGHAVLADAERDLGHLDAARAEAHRAVELAGVLSTEDRLAVEARDAALDDRWSDAVDRWQRVRALHPEDLDVGLALVEALWRASRNADAHALVEELRRLPPPAGDDPRLDLADSDIADDASDHRRAVDAETRALAGATRRGEKLLAAEAQVGRAWDEWELGALDAAVRDGEPAATVLSSAGDLDDAARAWNAVAAARWQQGRLAAALEANTRARALIHAAGNRALEASLLSNAGLARVRMGDLADARRLFDECSATNGGRTDDSTAWQTFGDGWIDLEAGDLVAAAKALDAALGESRTDGVRVLTAYVLDRQGELAFLRDDLASARRRAEEALALRTQLGTAGFAAESRVALARVALAEGKLDEAERFARSALDEHSREGALDGEADARAILSATLRAGGHLDAAAEALRGAVAKARESGNLAAESRAVAEAALVRAARRPAEKAQALADLDGILARLDGAGMTVAALSVRLVRARLAGDAAAVAAVVARARAVGAQRLVSEASSARAR